MTKEIIKKIQLFDFPIPSSDVSAEAKKIIYSVFEREGMSHSTVYLRVFSKGFDEWELLGVDAIKQDFLERYKKEMLMADSVDEEGNVQDGDRGYAAVLALNSDEPGGFYTAIKNAGLVRTFKDEMLSRGMSPHTTYTRFLVDDWKPWEAKGVKGIVKEICDMLQDDDDTENN